MNDLSIHDGVFPSCFGTYLGVSNERTRLAVNRPLKTSRSRIAEEKMKNAMYWHSVSQCFLEIRITHSPKRTIDILSIRLPCFLLTNGPPIGVLKAVTHSTFTIEYATVTTCFDVEMQGGFHVMIAVTKSM